jgi:predicted DNA-binding transcriptional regulator YafY
VLASRLLSILMLLQTRGRMSASQLAAEFEVAVRTIHRDIDQLSAAGIPVYADRGRAGGFRLQDGYRTKLTGLNQSEAEALFFAGLPGPAAQLGLADVLSTMRLKLLAALPANMQSSAERIATRFHLDVASWFHSVDQLPALPLMARAVWDERMLELRYRRASLAGGQLRRLGPLGLVLKGGIWYLVAHDGNGVRTYRAANIEDVAICDERFTRPKDFNLAAHWEEAVREYESGVYREQADVRLSPKGMRLLELLGPHVTSVAAKTAQQPDKRGWVRCTLPIESFEFGVRELMRLGEEVVVLGPPALRAQLAHTAQRIVKRHGRRQARDAASELRPA